MAEDPDYIAPAVLKKRAGASGGAGIKPGRPELRRVDEDAGPIKVGAVQGFKVVDYRVESRDIKVSNDGVRVSR